ncbi:MAG: pentapeptide repeat-containing protein [Leptolyngbyaceae cyanobacterium SM1_4_3]|nr:pentapeptide repeat-containing protein [Leptolyngbyaceae cyanobacterium SM1_4_3]
MDWEIYDLLGYGGLTIEIVQYLLILLTDLLSTEAASILFERLQRFYFRWCKGEFIDATPENLPQKKMRLLREQIKNHRDLNSLGQRQLDIYTGLNIMILLLELQSYISRKGNLDNDCIFHPCGQLNTDTFNEFQLLQIMGYSDCIDIGTCVDIIGPFLNSTDLSHSNLSVADFRGANLNSSNLQFSDLRSADLSSADLSNADLSYTDLRRANFSNTNFQSAKLIDADLRGTDIKTANLANSDLEGSNLSGADFRGSNLEGANFNSADLRGAYLKEVNLVDTSFIGSRLNRSDLRLTNLQQANLSSADLRGADLRGADLRGANLENAKLVRTNLMNVIWNELTNWPSSQELELAVNVPESLKLRLKNLGGKDER